MSNSTLTYKEAVEKALSMILILVFIMTMAFAIYTAGS